MKSSGKNPFLLRREGSRRRNARKCAHIGGAPCVVGERANGEAEQLVGVLTRFGATRGERAAEEFIERERKGKDDHILYTRRQGRGWQWCAVSLYCWKGHGRLARG